MILLTPLFDSHWHFHLDILMLAERQTLQMSFRVHFINNDIEPRKNVSNIDKFQWHHFDSPKAKEARNM